MEENVLIRLIQAVATGSNSRGRFQPAMGRRHAYYCAAGGVSARAGGSA